MVRPDERDEAPGWGLHEVTCRRCATTVLVRKSSRAQTSIQWRGDSAASCSELAEHRAAGVHPALVPACASLRQTIDDAVREGLVPVNE